MSTARTLADALREIETLRQRLTAMETSVRVAPPRGFARLGKAMLSAVIPGRELISGETDQWHCHTAAVKLIDIAVDGQWGDASERVRMRLDGSETVVVLNSWLDPTEATGELIIGELPNGLWLILGEACKTGS